MDELNNKIKQKQVQRMMEWLTDIHMTQKELAKITNYTEQYICGIKKGKRPLTEDVACAISQNTKLPLGNGVFTHVRKEWLLCESDIKTEHDKYLQCVAATEQWQMNSGLEMNGCAHDLIEAAIKNICLDKWESEGLETDKIIEKHIENDFPVLPEDDFMLIKNLVVDYAYSLVYSRLNNEKNQPLWLYVRGQRLKEL